MKRTDKWTRHYYTVSSEHSKKEKSKVGMGTVLEHPTIRWVSEISAKQ